MPDQWSTAVKPDQLYSFTIGRLCVWIRYSHGDWFVADCHEADEKPFTSWNVCTEEPEQVQWRRWVASDSDFNVRAIPILPDLPLLVRPEQPLVILPQKQALFYVSIPVSVEIQAGGTRLESIPTEILSKSWLGDPTAGELCYATRTRALRSLDTEPAAPASAICSVLIHNRTPEPMPFQRFCLRTEFLGVFEGRERLWTHPVEVVFLGSNQPSQLNVSVDPPEQEILSKLSDPRELPKRNLLRQSFQVFKQLTEL